MVQKEAKKEIVLSLILLSVSCLILINGYSYDSESRQFPVFLGWLFLLFSLIYVIRVLPLFKWEHTKFGLDKKLILPATVLLSVCLYAVLIPVIGYYVSSVVFLLPFMILFGAKREGVLQYLITTVVFLGTVFIFFSLILGTRLPTGDFWSFLGV